MSVPSKVLREEVAMSSTRQTKSIPIVMVALIGFCIFAPMVSAETAEEWFDKGVIYFRLEEYQKAIECFDKAIERDPNDADAYILRGLAYHGLEQYERAIEDYDKAIELDPNDAVPYYIRGNAYYYLKQYERAIEDSDKAIGLDPNDAYAYYIRGVAYANLKQYERAIEDFDKAIARDPNDASAYYKRGNAYDELNQHERAIEDYGKAIARDPNFGKAYENDVPGFEAIFEFVTGILMIFIIVFLLRRRKLKKISWKAIIVGGIVSVFLSNVLFFTGLIMPLIIIISALIGGLMAGKISTDEGWKHGLGVGIFYLVIHVPLNLIFTPELQNIESIIIPFHIIGYTIGAMVITIPSGIIGGFLGSKL